MTLLVSWAMSLKIVELSLLKLAKERLGTKITPTETTGNEHIQLSRFSFAKFVRACESLLSSLMQNRGSNQACSSCRKEPNQTGWKQFPWLVKVRKTEIN